jgi:hypothetical protein
MDPGKSIVPKSKLFHKMSFEVPLFFLSGSDPFTIDCLVRLHNKQLSLKKFIYLILKRLSEIENKIMVKDPRAHLRNGNQVLDLKLFIHIDRSILSHLTSKIFELKSQNQETKMVNNSPISSLEFLEVLFKTIMNSFNDSMSNESSHVRQLIMFILRLIQKNRNFLKSFQQFLHCLLQNCLEHINMKLLNDLLLIISKNPYGDYT